MVLYFLLCLFPNDIRLVLQAYMILAEILVETAFLQVELVNQQTARYGREQYTVLHGTMDNDGCIIGMLTSYELVESVADGMVLCCKWCVFN